MPVSRSVDTRSRRARPRGHLAAVPAQAPALVTSVGSAPASVVARDAQAELVALSDALHDGPVQSLIAASMALQLAERAGADTAGLAAVREALSDALTALRGTMSALKPPGAATGLGEMLTALRERTGHLALDDQATGAVSAELAQGVFGLLAALGVTETGVPALTVLTRDKPGVVICEVRLRGADATARSHRDEVTRALRRLDALGARAAVARASGGADLLIALPADTRSAPSPAVAPQALLGPALLTHHRGDRRSGSAHALAPTGSEDPR